MDAETREGDPYPGMVWIEEFVVATWDGAGGSLCEHAWLSRAFVAKLVLRLKTTKPMIDRCVDFADLHCARSCIVSFGKGSIVNFSICF